MNQSLVFQIPHFISHRLILFWMWNSLAYVAKSPKFSTPRCLGYKDGDFLLSWGSLLNPISWSSAFGDRLSDKPSETPKYHSWAFVSQSLEVTLCLPLNWNPLTLDAQAKCNPKFMYLIFQICELDGHSISPFKSSSTHPWFQVPCKV